VHSRLTCICVHAHVCRGSFGCACVFVCKYLSVRVRVFAVMGQLCVVGSLDDAVSFAKDTCTHRALLQPNPIKLGTFAKETLLAP